MCFPLIGLIAGIAGAAVSAAGAAQQADAQAAQAEYNAKVAEINAKTARQQGVYEADKVQDRAKEMAARQRVAFAKAGATPFGSPLLTAQDTAGDSWMDQATAIWNRGTEATGYQNKAADLRTQAQNYRSAGKIAAAGSFLSGLGGAAKGFSGLGASLTIS